MTYGFTPRPVSAKALARAKEEAEARAAAWPVCPVCRGRVSTGRSIYALCEPDTLAGKTCTCPPGCTTGDRWGDGPRPCSPDCAPCTMRRGQMLEVRKKGTQK